MLHHHHTVAGRPMVVMMAYVDALYDTADGTETVGRVTSGGFGPSLEGPIAMGVLPSALAVPGTSVYAEVRGQRLPCAVVPLPFRPAGFKRS